MGATAGCNSCKTATQVVRLPLVPQFCNEKRTATKKALKIAGFIKHLPKRNATHRVILAKPSYQ
jgi:hypothetical protein